MCDTYGAGYYYIPGSNTCLSISGTVAAAFSYTGTSVGGTTVTSSGAYLNAFVYANATFDARTQTEYGLLRSVFTVQGERGSDPWAPGASTGSATTGVIAAVYPQTASYFAMTNAFIQLGGLTIGYAPSFYNAATTAWSTLDAGTLGPNNKNTLQLAYTASFGGGFLASIAIEDPKYRRTNATNGLNSTAAANAISYAGAVLPNFVAALRVEQGWGSAQINGALNELRAYNGTGLNDVSTGLGFAVGGGLTVKLDSLAKGDYISLAANYASGATGYLFNRTPRDGGILAATTWGVGRASASIEDFQFANGGIQNVTGFGVHGSFRHYFTPALYGTLFGAYITTSAPVGYTGTVFQNVTFGANVAYQPVKGFEIGLEGYWRGLNATDQAGGYTGTARGTTGYDSDWTAMLIAKRFF